eukprot:TRINITY_DN1427_c0_g1_i1.p1 TRINITY_DN1427_c0_g1~~TRINITY_DN1427_c0_g1_i1.p1  ORF type:complete len:389 (-),score=70.43 TRINITY_DN1427_c0_g1_i1:219-1385(-)
MPAKKKQRRGRAQEPPSNGRPADGSADDVRLLDLSDELLEMIARDLSPTDLASLARCHSRLRLVSLSNSVWQWMYSRDFPGGRAAAGTIGWRMCYKRAAQAPPRQDARRMDILADLPRDHVPLSFCVDSVRQRVVALTRPAFGGPWWYVSAVKLPSASRVALNDLRELTDCSRIMLDQAADELVIFHNMPSVLVVLDAAFLQKRRQVSIGDARLSTWCVHGGRMFAIQSDSHDVLRAFCTTTGAELWSMSSSVDPTFFQPHLLISPRGHLLIGGADMEDVLGVFITELPSSDNGLELPRLLGAERWWSWTTTPMAFSPDGWAADVCFEHLEDGKQIRFGVQVIGEDRAGVVSRWMQPEDHIQSIRALGWSDHGLVVQLQDSLILLRNR